MSKTKFNGFEKYFIITALKHAIEEAENDIKEMEEDGRRSIYAQGYFRMVGKELIEKFDLRQKQNKKWHLFDFFERSF